MELPCLNTYGLLGSHETRTQFGQDDTAWQLGENCASLHFPSRWLAAWFAFHKRKQTAMSKALTLQWKAPDHIAVIDARINQLTMHSILNVTAFNFSRSVLKLVRWRERWKKIHTDFQHLIINNWYIFTQFIPCHKPVFTIFYSRVVLSLLDKTIFLVFQNNRMRWPQHLSRMRWALGAF